MFNKTHSYNYKPPIGSTLNKNHPLSSNMMAAYLFNEHSGNIALDISNNENHGVLKNGASFLNGMLFLDGVNDYVEVPDSPSLTTTNELTIVARINSTNIQSRWNDLIGKGTSDTDEEYAIALLNGGFYFDVGINTGPYVNQTQYFNNNTFHRIAAVHKKILGNSIMQTYRDGYIGTGGVNNPSFAMNNNSLPMSIGKRFYNSDPNSRIFSGFIDYIYLFNKALSTNELNDIYENPFLFIDPPSSIKYFAINKSNLYVPSITSQEKLGVNIFPGPISIGPNSIASSENIPNPVNKVKNPEGKCSTTLEFNKNLQTTALVSINPPTPSATIFGSTGSTRYSYRITSCNEYGESTAGTNVIITNGNATLSSSNYVRISWLHIENATYYKIYGRTENNEKLIATVYKSLHYDDNGSIPNPYGDLPIKNTTGYHPNKLNLGRLMRLYTDDKDKNKNFISPLILKIFNCDYNVAGTGGIDMATYKFSDDIDYIFVASTSAQTYHYISLFEYDKRTNEMSYRGYLYWYSTIFTSGYTWTWDSFNLTVDNYSIGLISGAGTPKYDAGLTRRKLKGYFSDSQVYQRNDRLLNGPEEEIEILTNSASVSTYSGQFIFDFKGHFYAPTTGTYTFYITSDDTSYFYINYKAERTYLTTYDQTTTWNTGTKSYSITLQAGSYTPIRVVQENISSTGFLTFEFEGPGIVKTTDGTGYFFTKRFEVTGTNTTWLSEKIASGARIGFGSTEPSKIEKWHDIAAIYSNTSLSVSDEIMDVISPNTPYCIQEMRFIYYGLYDLTSAQNSIHIIKGINPNIFKNTGHFINSATTVDNLRAIYRLKDFASSTLNNVYQISIAPKIDKDNQYIYLLNVPTSSTTLRIYKFNLRTSLNDLSGGVSLAGYMYRTNTITGLFEMFGRNYRYAPVVSAESGRSKNIPSIFGTAYGRNPNTNEYKSWVIRISESSIKADTDFPIDIAPFVPTTSRDVLRNATYRKISYDPVIDKFIGSNFADWAYGKNYITDLNFNEEINYAPLGHHARWRNEPSNSDYSAKNEYRSDFTLQSWNDTEICNGILYRRHSSFVYAEPIHADLNFADKTKNFIVTPIIGCANNVKFDKISVNFDEYVGDYEQGFQPDLFKVYARVSGMNDDSGPWTEVINSDISSFAVSDKIQFKFTYKIIGMLGIVARIHSISVNYFTNDNINDENIIDFDSTNDNTILLEQKNTYSKLPIFNISLYDSNNSLILSQNTDVKTYGALYQYDNNNWYTSKFRDITFKNVFTSYGVTYSDTKLTGISSAYFDGSSYLSSPNSANYNFRTNDFSIDIVFKVFSNTDFGSSNLRLLSFGGMGRSNGWEIGRELVEGVYKLVFYIGNSSANVMLIICDWTKVNDNQWHRVSVDRSGNLFSSAVDTVLSPTTLTYTGDINNITDSLFIGGGNTNNPTQFFKGYIDEIKIYNNSRYALVSSAGYSDLGIRATRYEGYFGDNPDYFTFTAQTSTSIVTNTLLSSIGDYYSYQFLGFFVAPTTGSYSFRTTSDDASYMWLGSTAVSGYTVGNSLINNGGIHGNATVTSSINLVANETYYIRLQFGENAGGDYFLFEYLLPGGAWSSNLDNGAFYASYSPTANYVIKINSNSISNNFRSDNSSYNLLMDMNDFSNVPGTKRKFVFNNGILSDSTFYNFRIKLK
jgi:hypothetical protein